jgi:hypothetical protein
MWSSMKGSDVTNRSVVISVKADVVTLTGDGNLKNKPGHFRP